MTATEIAATVFGWVGNILVMLINIPQMIKTVKTKSTKDISLGTNILLAMVLVILFIYGILIGELPIIIGNIVSFIIMLPILILKLTEKRREKTEVEEFNHRDRYTTMDDYIPMKPLKRVKEEFTIKEIRKAEPKVFDE